MKKALIRQGQTYGFGDFIRIPFAVCPLYTSIKIAIRILTALLPAFQVLATAAFVDAALAIFGGREQREAIWPPLACLLLMIFYQNLIRQIMSCVNLKAEMRLMEEYRSAVCEKRASLEYCHIENNDTWDLITRTCTDPVKKINEGFDHLMAAGDILLRGISLLTILMAQVWWAGPAVVAISAPLFALAVKSGKEIYEENREALKFTRRADYLRGVLQGRESADERAMFEFGKRVNQEWYEKYEAARKIELKVSVRYYLRMKSSSLITVLLSLLIICVLLFPLKSGAVSVGMFMGLATATLNLVQIMSWDFTETMKGIAAGLEYLKDLTCFAALSETPGALDQPQDQGHVPFEGLVFRHVSFRYPGTEKEVLKDFSLEIKPGRHYAFVGINGAGKTTITKLLTGLYDQYEGEILLNHRELRTYSQSELKAAFAVVCQDFARYQIPLDENIALGNVLQRDQSRIEKVAEMAGLGPAIEKLPEGIRTPLGKINEKGTDLSGGEWQKVAIARALYHPAQVQILDEPTAALDPKAESSVYEMFGRVSAGKTAVFITHRLGAARLADEIIVINDGAAAEKGDHETHLSRGGIYARMIEAQRSWSQ